MTAVTLRKPKAAGPAIDGEVAPGFEAVARAFDENFEREGELGAAVCIFRHGRIVVDLWGGLEDQGAALPWRRDTRAPLFSTGKGAIAVACALAVSRGLFAYDDPIALYWPEFAGRGKDAITMRHVLDHAAGLALFGRAVGPDELDDPVAMAEIVEAMEPVWAPGQAWGYHLATLGVVTSQLIARTDPARRSLARFFEDEIARPLGLDLRFGLAERETCAEVGGPGISQLRDVLMRGPFSLQSQMLNPFSLLHKTMREVAFRPEDKTWLRHDLPSGNAVASARSVARLYAALATGGGDLGLAPHVMADIAACARVPPEGARDRVMGVDSHWRLGFIRPTNDFPFSPSQEAFGMPGLGGSFGFADPTQGIGYGYTPNRLGLLPFDDRRDARLRKALHLSLARLPTR